MMQFVLPKELSPHRFLNFFEEINDMVGIIPKVSSA
jgi:hypothetical protein